MDKFTSTGSNNQPTQDEAINKRRAFWGTIALEGILLLLMTYFLVITFSQPERTTIHYIATVLSLATFASIVASMVLTIRGRQEIGLQITLYTLFIFGILVTTIFQGRILTASFSILTTSILAIVWLARRSMQRQLWISLTAAMALMWIVEWFDPPWRLGVSAAKIGPAAVVVFAGLLAVTFVKQIWRGNIRTKLITSFLGTSIIPLVILTLINYQSTQNLLEEEVLRTMAGYNETYESIVATERKSAEALALSIADREDVQQTYLSGNREALYELLAPMFVEWKERQIVHLYIENPDGTVFLRVHSPDKYGDDVTYRESAKIALTDKTVTSGVEVGPSRLGVRGVAPMYSSSGRFIGMTEVGLDFDENFITTLKQEIGADFTMWVTYEAASIPSLKPIESAPTAPIDEVFFYASTLSNDIHASPEVYKSVLDTGEPVFQILTTADPPTIVYVTPLLGYNNKLLGLLQISKPYAQTIAAQNNITITTALVAAFLLFLTAVAVNTLANRLVIKPVAELHVFAENQVRGEIQARVSVKSDDEFETLANTFNLMANAVESERQTLESRVADRTRNLELAAEVGRAVSQVRHLDVMLRDACELILKEFNLYYVQVYLTDASGSTLKLEAGTGSVGAQLVGRGHSLPLDTGSINGRAAIEKRSVVISDTAQSATFRQNPLLPETRGEIAVPLIVADKVVGVLDMQSSQSGVLNKGILPAFEALAGQLAVAVQNADLLAETQQARAQVEAQARRLVREGWYDYLDAIHKPEQIGFVFDNNKIAPLADVDESQLPEDGKAISVPIAVTGESLGSLVVEIADETRREQTSELVNVVARQVAQQIENLRLLESAERYRYEAERAARLQTIEGWQKYIESRSPESLGYLYDTKEVRPQSNGQGEDISMFAMPLKARDEMIGKLSVQGLTHEDQESVELVNAVAERLSAHIENLRLFEETRLGQFELDKRARQLAAVAEISNVSSKELDIQKMLESVVHLTQRQFGLYHAHVFLYNESTEELKIAACGWKEGDEHEGTHGTTAIPVSQEQSLVARAARTRKAVIVNNVFVEPGWLPNPMLPDTASELAVPLVIGDQVLGVLDVQSDHINAFTEEDANIQTTLASQVATALQNARSFSQAQKQAEREAMLNVINQKIQSATSVEAVLQIAARELGHALGAPMTIAQLSMKDKSS